MHRCVDQCVQMPQEGGFEPGHLGSHYKWAINPWFKPLNRSMFYVMMYRSRLIGFVFEALQVKFGTCSPQCQAGRPKGGRAA
jgi:hypothetical protein